MRRDPEIIRAVLLRVEEEGDSDFLESEDSAFAYHARLLIEAGYTKGEISSGGSAFVWELTWQGHDLIDALRDETVFRKTTERVQKTVGSVTMEALKGIASGIAEGIVRGGT